MKALNDLSKEESFDIKAFSVCDARADKRYIETSRHKGFKGNKFLFSIIAFAEGIKSDLVICGHLNIAPIGLLIKIFKPGVKFILIAHGIEIWQRQSLIKRIFIKNTDTILAVSSFTKSKILEHNEIVPEKIVIFPNTLDPFFKIPDKQIKPEYLLKRYNLAEDSKIILTISRINKYEGYKGYDKIIDAMPQLIKKIPNLKYILCGKYGSSEEKRIKEKAKQLGLENYFLLPGYIHEEEITDHYLLSDVFAMPSKKEGFGIVFIEALACGIPVIAGNKDGSVDALMNGKIGTLIDPENIDNLAEAIFNILNNTPVDYKNLIIENFGFDIFKKRLRNCLVEN